MNFRFSVKKSSSSFNFNFLRITCAIIFYEANETICRSMPLILLVFDNFKPLKYITLQNVLVPNFRYFFLPNRSEPLVDQYEQWIWRYNQSYYIQWLWLQPFFCALLTTSRTFGLIKYVKCGNSNSKHTFCA